MNLFNMPTPYHPDRNRAYDYVYRALEACDIHSRVNKSSGAIYIPPTDEFIRAEKSLKNLCVSSNECLWKTKITDIPGGGKKVELVQQLEPSVKYETPLDLAAISDDEVKEAAKRIQEEAVSVVKRLMDQKKTLDSGVWYYYDLKKAAEEAGKTIPEEWYYGHLDENFFERGKACQFFLKEGKPPSDAIRSMWEGPSLIDCGNSCELVWFQVLLNLIGEEKFNRYFTQPKMRLRFVQSPHKDESPLLILLNLKADLTHLETGVFGYRPIPVGTHCHIGGVRHYLHKHPGGYMRGINCFKIGTNEKGEDLFGGMHFVKPMTEREVCQTLIDGYNEERKEIEEENIRIAGYPDIFDCNKNPMLRDFYTISHKSSPEVHCKGFTLGTEFTLDPRKLLIILNPKTLASGK